MHVSNLKLPYSILNLSTLLCVIRAHGTGAEEQQ
jgi:hypothetical protein